MPAVTARVSTKYQVVIPKAVREVLGLRPQDSVVFVIEGDTVSVRPLPASLSAALRGLHADLWPDPDGCVDEERGSWE